MVQHIREELAELVNYSVRQIQGIENEGQFPSIQSLSKIFLVSLDHYLFDEEPVSKSSVRRQLDSVLDSLGDRDLLIIKATAESLCKAKEITED